MKVATAVYLSLLLLYLSLEAAAAKTIDIPYSVTFVTQGAIGDGSYDDLDLFGSKNLIGLPFANEFTLTKPWTVTTEGGGYYKLIYASTTDTFSVNGYSFSFAGNGLGGNYSFSTYDRRAALVEGSQGSYDDIRAFTGVDRTPPLWYTDLSSANIFSNNTVVGSGGGLFGIFELSKGWVTNLELDNTSITSTHTTITITLPEQSTWILKLFGFAGLALASYASFHRKRVTAAA